MRESSIKPSKSKDFNPSLLTDFDSFDYSPAITKSDAPEERGFLPSNNQKTSIKPDVSFSLDTVAQMNIFDVPVSVVTRYVAKQLQTSNRIAERIKFKGIAAALLGRLGFTEAADKLRRCCANTSTLVCGNGHSFRTIVDFRCHLPFCPDCWETKAHRELSRVLPKFLQALKDDPSLFVAFVTLTLKSDNNRDLRSGCREIKKGFRALRKRNVWADCVGGFGRIENTFSTKFGFHPHIHNLVLLKDYIPQAALSDAWLKITGDSKIVDIRQVHDITAGLVETIKYPFKPSDLLKLGKEQIQEMLDLTGEKLGLSFGVLFGMEVEEGIEVETEGETAEYAEFVEQTKALEIGDCCPICRTKLDLIDFSRSDYGRFLSCVQIPEKRE